MTSIDLILDYIVKTNILNFVVFVVIFVYLFHKINLIGVIEKSKQNVISAIEESKAKKTESENNLQIIEQAFSEVGEEINSIFKRTDESVKLVGEKIDKELVQEVNGIKENSAKLVEHKVSILKSDILNRVSTATVEIAKAHIIKELENNTGLHDKLIDDSIDTIEGVNI